MDAADLKILDALQEDGRLTSNELAERVGLSASQCSRRRMALEAEGIIAHYHAELSPQALGLDVVAFVRVALNAHSPENAAKFVELVNKRDEIQEAYALTGESDYVVKVLVPTLADLSRLLADVLLPHPSVANVRSSIVLNQLKRTNKISLKHLRKKNSR